MTDMIELPRNETDILIDTLSAPARRFIEILGDRDNYTFDWDGSLNLFWHEHPHIRELIGLGFYGYDAARRRLDGYIKITREFRGHEAHERIKCGEYERCKELFANMEQRSQASEEQQAAMEQCELWGAF